LFSNTYLSIPGGGAGARTHRRGFLLVDSAHAQALLARLDTLAALVDFPASDMTSTWARTLNRRLVAGLDTARLRHPIEREAATYVRNWTGTFEETSVAATLFTEWLDAEAHLNALSDSSVASDTTFFAGVRRNRAFRTALDTLTRRYGRDLRQWRWGRVVPHLMWFPGYGLPGLDQPSRRRYGPLERPGGGHPTALAYGPEAPGGPVTTYSFDASFRRNAPLRLHRFDFDADRFLARYRLPLSVDPVGVAPQRPTSVTRLTPR
ncbi:MAG TPA: penicillin acylase family protein, partial [Rhodothermales bacterium]|nr:penicillin acylase family protein [Rhodothermales bacterium]